MAYESTGYRAKDSWKKFAQMLVAGLAGGATLDGLVVIAIQWARAQWPEWVAWDKTSDAAIGAWVMTAGGAAVARLMQNWGKHGESWVSDVTLAVLKRIGMGCAIGCLALPLAGCVGMNPALRKPTTGNQYFEERTEAVVDTVTGTVIAPATVTIWKNEYSVAAGADATQVAGMRYSADGGDGSSWDLNISGDNAADTSGQAEALVAIGQLQLEAFKTGAGIAGGIATAAIPIAEQAVQGSNDRRMYRLQNPGPSTLEQVDSSSTLQGLFERWDARLTRLERQWSQILERLQLQDPLAAGTE